MAGIGFELKQLTKQDNLIGVVHAYASAGFAAAGPWLFTILAIAGITLLYANFLSYDNLINFRVVLVYNLAASLVLSAPVFMVITRYIADRIHANDVRSVPSTLLGCMVLLIAIQLPFALPFYGWYVDVSLSMRLAAIANLFLLTGVWLLGVYLMALKDFHAVNFSYGIGMVIAVLLAQWLKTDYGAVGMLMGFNIGIAFILFTLIAKVFAEYPYASGDHFAMMDYFGKYKELAIGGFFYNLAIWIDKLIMWFAPERTLLANKMIMYPDYDSAMFLAYATIVPAMAIFVFSVETHFFERYRTFYDHILEHKSLQKVLDNSKKLMDTVVHHARNFILVQGTLSLLALLLAAQILGSLNINYHQIGIFRLGVLGGLFHVLALFQMIILSYFDHRKVVMWIQGFFLLSNIIFTLISMNMGFAYYGYGYFLSALLTFILTSVVMFRHLSELPYHAFITHNNAVKK